METPKNKRKSIMDLFDLKLDDSPSSQSSSPLTGFRKRQDMAQKLKGTIKTKWPSMSDTTRQTGVSMTIRADEVYRTYTDAQNPRELFEKATGYLDNLRKSQRTQQQEEILIKEIHEMMIHAIFGSNRIEGAGLNLDITINLCRQILRGEEVKDIDERTPEYQSKLMELSRLDDSLKDMPLQFIMRGRREIVQHAKAMMYLFHNFVALELDLTEDLIKETHSILCKGVSILDPEHPEVPSEAYAGKYRDVIVSAGNTNFVRPDAVPRNMTKMCEDLKNELKTASETSSVDPFSLASKYSLQFVEIHPFRDGNGRMCRLILNAIVFRFAGIVAPIGERETDRDEYISIKRRASQYADGHGEYATFVLGKATKSLQKIKKKLHGKKGGGSTK